MHAASDNAATAVGFLVCGHECCRAARISVPRCQMSTADAALLEAVALLNPRTMDRAKRLCCAVQLLRTGVPASEVREAIRVRFKIGRSAAWVVVEMAEDMVVDKR